MLGEEDRCVGEKKSNEETDKKHLPTYVGLHRNHTESVTGGGHGRVGELRLWE